MRGFKLCDSSMLVKFRFIRISLGKQFLVAVQTGSSEIGFVITFCVKPFLKDPELMFW